MTSPAGVVGRRFGSVAVCMIYDEDGTVAARLRASRGQDGPLTFRPIRGGFYLMAQFP